jgi:glycosyltransferase involved in cell wall biosynthesis
MELIQTDSAFILFVFYILFIVVTVIQLFYFWAIYARLLFYKKSYSKDLIKPVSVVISAKNEYLNLRNNLPIILNQNHPDFEVVVVNDSSDDETLELLEDIAKQENKLKIVNIPQSLNFFTGKKFPLSIGIKSAKNDIIVLTDADCRPVSENWLRKIQSNFQGDKTIVLGYGGYEKRKGFLNKIIQYDTLQIAIQYMSYALLKIPYMGVGRNLAYSKSLFYDNKGFTSHYKIQSGDDDLFINKVANKHNTSIEIDPDTHTLSTPKKSFAEWIRQKRRHIGTGKYYKGKHKFLLGLYSLSRFMFLAFFIFLIASAYNINIILPLFILRLISFLIVYKFCMKKFAVNNLLVISPFLEIFFVIFIPIVVISGILHKKDKWK